MRAQPGYERFNYLRKAPRMKARARFIRIASCLACLGCAHNKEMSQALVLKKLDLEGPQQVSKREIEKRIATAETGWWWPFASKKYFDSVVWQSDLRRIERVYEAHGFYQAEVVSDEVTAVKGGVAVKAVISEGRPTRIESFDVRGLEPLLPAEREQLLADLGLDLGSVFLEGRWQSAKDRIRQRLRDFGFAEAVIEGRAWVDVRTQTASLLVVARPGVHYRFGDIQVDSGSEGALNPGWVWEQVRLAIPEGKPFSDEALAEAQRRVFGMGLFSVVKVIAGAPDQAAARIPILVDVRPAPLRTLRAGAGLRIDQIRNEARLIAEWTHRNFMGGMRKLTERAEAGWAFIPNIYAARSNDPTLGVRNGPIARSSLQFEQPRLAGHPALREQTTLDLERTLEQSYDALGGRVATGVVWQLWSTLNVHLTYNVQGFWLNGPPIASAGSAPLTLGCAATSNSCFILLSYLEEAIAWDRRDSALDAHKGVFASFAVQEGGGPLAGDFTYLRFLPEARGYVSFGEHDPLTLSARLRVGELLTSGGQSAVVTRFFAGGGISMRGFNDRRLSPLLQAPAPASPGATPALLTLPIGGDGLIEGSFEARYRLTDSLVLAAFVDFGQVTEGRIGPNDLPTVLWALGFGFRYRTAIGPIRIDFARRLQRGSPPPLLSIDSTTGAISRVPYQVDDSCFGLGGSKRTTVVSDNLCVFHLAIGEAF